MLIGNYFKKINLKYKRHYFSGLSFNSLTCKKDDIFFAIRGSTIDGNKFINDAITKGAKTPEEKARRIEKFVHRNVVYDNSVEKYFDHVKFPIETLIEKNGDCEDMAILETALLKAAGLDAVLITFPRGLREEDIAHVGVGIDGNFTGYSFPDKGKNYYFDEPTGVNSPIGKIDPIYKKSLFQIVKPK